jgi:hypothetical protein
MAVLRTLDTLSGEVFADLDPARREAVAAGLLENGGEALTYLNQIVLQCYYRDDRVMWSLDREVGRLSPKSSKWSKATGRCWTRCARGRGFIGKCSSAVPSP